MSELGRIAYEAYSRDAGGRSIHGEPLPLWPEQSDEIRAHWDAAAAAVADAAIGGVPG